MSKTRRSLLKMAGQGLIATPIGSSIFACSAAKSSTSNSQSNKEAKQEISDRKASKLVFNGAVTIEPPKIPEPVPAKPYQLY